MLIGWVPLLLALLFVFRPHALGDGTYVNLYNAAEVAAVVAVVIGVWRWRPQPLWPWVLIALTIALWVVGDIVYGTLGTDPTVSIADAFYLAGYLPLVLGVVWLVKTDAGQGSGDSFIDVAIISLAALYASWGLLIEPAWDQAGVSGIARFVVVSYPILDAALLVLVAQLLFARRRTVTVALFAFGMVIVFVGDIGYAIVAQTGSFVGSTLLDASWPLGYALVALAVLHPSVGASRPTMANTRPLHPTRLLAAVSALIAIPAVAAISEHVNDKLEPVPLMVASIAVVALVFWRVLRLYHRADVAAGALEQSERYFRALAMNSSDAYALIADDGTVTDTSLEIEKVIGWTRDDTVGKSAATHVDELVHPDDASLASAFLERARGHAQRDPVSVELRVRRPEGTFGWIEAHATNLLDDPAVRGIVLNIHDVDQRKRAEEDLRHQAFHDPLTGLANRALLRDRIEQALARSSRGAGGVAVLFCDLDGFKTVNDTLGHDAGDELLQVAAARLLSLARGGDTVARLGGDEFAVVVEGGAELLDGAVTLASRMLQSLSDPVEIADTPMVMTASIGIALTADADPDERASTPDELLRRADIAMYDAKAAGRNRSSIYDSATSSATINQLSMTRELLDALERDEFIVHYQPVVELSTQRLTGFEALIRWQHPTRGMVPPLDFIPVAEESGAIIEIGRWVLRQACAAAVQWPSEDEAEPLTVAVNVAARQLDTDALITDVAAALEASGLQPQRLVLELTESTLVTRPDAVAKRLIQLRQLGVRIAIDDFGTGYSSLSYLQRFPIDILKIDRSFTETIDDANRLPAILQGLVELGRTLELEVIAEGIERPEQQTALAREGCQLGQGFLFSRPISQEEAITLADSMLRRPLILRNR
jgi:diguanylate cyclase (GGDEF)-like protein/PAS domain S-box-containing protein